MSAKKPKEAPSSEKIQARLDHLRFIWQEGGRLHFEQPSSDGELLISECPKFAEPKVVLEWIKQENIKRHAEFLLDFVSTCQALGWTPLVLLNPGDFVQPNTSDRAREIIKTAAERNRPLLLNLLRQANGPVYEGLRKATRIIRDEATGEAHAWQAAAMGNRNETKADKKGATATGGRPCLPETDPKFMVYDFIRRESESGRTRLSILDRLKGNKDFMELATAAHLKVNKKLVNNARAFSLRKKQETHPS